MNDELIEQIAAEVDDAVRVRRLQFILDGRTLRAEAVECDGLSGGKVITIRLVEAT